MNSATRNNRKLRTGLTTGTCAAAAAKAASLLLLLDEKVEEAVVETDADNFLSVAISNIAQKTNSVTASVVKDAGDDPDVTDGIEIVVTVAKNEGTEITVEGGEGVGRVTKPGLKIPAGRAAINPVPLRMIRREVAKVRERSGYAGGLDVIVSVPKGREVATKTMNARLGIVDGISILGTTGIVEPMSEKALIDTLKTEIDMHVAAGRRILYVTPGNYGRNFAKTELGFDMGDAVKCSNFIGEILDYVREIGTEKIILVGHAGKLIKLAGGVMNTHSSVADCRMEIFAAHAAMQGVPAETIRDIMNCTTVEAAMDRIEDKDLLQRIWKSVGRKIAFHLNYRTKGKPPVEFVVFTLEAGVLCRSKMEAFESFEES